MKAIGIDLGTTNSVISRYDEGRSAATVLTNGEGEVLTPSVVAMRSRDGKESLLVGRTAVNYAGRQPQNTIVSVKRLMGRDYADPAVVEARDRLAYPIVAGPDEDPRAHVMLSDRRYRPAEVSGLILKKLKQDASRFVGDEVTHAVITVPAYFHDSQRAATRDAGHQAGLIVKKIIDEPTAAAIAFGMDAGQERRRILVYDLGGGTFDISILNMVKGTQGHGQFQVLDFHGDSWLGGDDFDLAIVERIVEWVKAECGVDPSGDRQFRYLAKAAAESAKRQLSQVQEADIIIPAAFRPDDGGPLVDVEMTLTRDEFNAMVRELVDRTMRLVKEALNRQSLERDDITDVLLVGGSTLTPLVYQTVESFFGAGKVRRDINPMECVALGAGLLAGTMQGVECPQCGKSNEDTAAVCESCDASLAGAQPLQAPVIYEVTGMALGIGAVKGTQRDIFVPIIPRGTPYPLAEPRRKSFNATDGRRIRVPVYEGDNPVASRNNEQGVIEFELPQDIGAASRVDVTFNYDSDRIVTVLISVPGTDMAKETTLRTDTRRTPPPDQEKEDDAATVREQLTYTISDAHRFLDSYGEFVQEHQTMKIRRDIDQAQHVLNFGDTPECRRMIALLRQDMYSSGIASQFLLAERAADGAPPQLARDINAAVASVQRSYRGGNTEQAAEQARLLKALVARVFVQRSVPGGDDLNRDGLLEVSEEYLPRYEG
ncbi:Chaperone protein DnaK [Streptomyces sp. RB5]|uniref:Chaperone protein DnaK n=1 Tax=Streptomyces smaragdinus TaxID=2585196 RepID=A0A7K0CIN0_9ACTN|nr:Hsp70 family protein [Streptomyces smaragdinus]MQY12594.1 Chaperone protein DnaK [Streptomyces smaragdinus]